MGKSTVAVNLAFALHKKGGDPGGKVGGDGSCCWLGAFGRSYQECSDQMVAGSNCVMAC